MDFLDRTRAGYDAAATEFAVLFENYLDDKPIEKALLAAFAELVRATGTTSVVDVGCGTGVTTRMLADSGVGGVCAWYSVIHVPDSHLPQTFSEFHRILVDGGVALLAFQVGDRPRRLTEAFGMPVDLEFVRREPAVVAATLEAAGLPVYSTTVRQPDDDRVQTTPQAFLVARKRSAR